jgi:putative transposase
MPYDPERHHRRSIRLPGYDYTRGGAYFVTICTYQRACLFDDPRLRSIAERCWKALAHHRSPIILDAWVVMPNHVHGIMVITDGDHANDPAADIAGHAGETHDRPPITTTDAINGHATIGRTGGAQQRTPINMADAIVRNASQSRPSWSSVAAAAPLRSNAYHQPTGLGFNVPPGSLGAMVRTYKSTVTRFVNRVRRAPGMPVWQRGYWERIIRDERHLAATRRYIANNPRRWAEDRDQLEALLARMNSRD